MIRITVAYPNDPSDFFNWDYYLTTHREKVLKALIPYGLVRLEIDKGQKAFGNSPHYVAVAHLTFESAEGLDRGFAEEGPSVIADFPNFTNVTPTLQVSEIVDECTIDDTEPALDDGDDE